KVSITSVKLQAAQLSIAHAVGTPTQKVITAQIGGMSLKDLAELAEEFDVLGLTKPSHTLIHDVSATGTQPENTVPTKPAKLLQKGSENDDS
ncbi:unnamed protein product, partial [marine sediment metagenome]